MAIETVSAEEYATLKAICAKAAAYWDKHATQGKRGSFMSAELCAHPDYAACTNDMRGKVEQYELLANPPERIVAYIGAPNKNGMGVDRTYGQTYPVTVWTGQPLGYATRGGGWRVRSHWGTHMFPFYARIAGREYYGRGFGEGMAISLRETAASKRARAKSGV